MRLSTPISNIAKIGPVYAKRLKKMGIQKAGDLLFHFPSRYIDFSQIKKIADLKINETACIKGKIEKIENQTTYKRKLILTKAVIKDKTGLISATWFNQPYLLKTLKMGDRVYLAGKVASSKQGVYLANPIYERLSGFGQETGPTHTARLVPVYPEIRGVSSRFLRYIIKPLLYELKDKIPETLPENIIKENNLLPLAKALLQIHFPDSLNLAEQAKKRFAFEELFLLELFVLSKKQAMAELKAVSIPIGLKTIQEFAKSLPFQLTDDQKKVCWQILKDLEKPKPMSRLLQGDVGSGKTVVAAMAALNTAKAGYQVAFMAPTEILSKQHFQTLADLLQGFKVDIGLLTSKTDKYVSKKLKKQAIEISRKKLLEKTLKGEIDILIGTHALIQEKVRFGNLALVILDEQHRFGVKQRAKLIQNVNSAAGVPLPKLQCRQRQAENSTATSAAGEEGQKVKGVQDGAHNVKATSAAGRPIPHLLSMTATPIPRSLALTVYGDLDLSLIKKMPKGKRKVITRLISQSKKETAYNLIEREIKKGRQAFVICPRIEEKEVAEGEEDKTGWAEVKAVKAEYERLSKKVFPNFKLAILHSKVPALEKNQAMKDFQKGKIDILVSTSVIEVGIDIPNATIMLIEDAERFGLAQLHQFRGRIGRRGDESYCLLAYSAKSKNAQKRLKALAEIENGLELAEKDLKIRGPGQFFGTKQWGLPDIAMNALDNFSLVEKTRETAKEILSKDPKLKDHPVLKKRLTKFGQTVHLE